MEIAPPQLDVTPVRRALEPATLRALCDDLAALRRRALDLEAEHGEALARVHVSNRPSARNLLHYLALRQEDMRPLQLRLAQAGLSSLGRSEAHVLVSLDRVLGVLALALGEAPGPAGEDAAPVGFRHGEALLARNAARLFGPPAARRRVRIMVTLPSEAADAPDLVRAMVKAGMNCARINCAHDDPDAWERMAAHVASARRDLGAGCRIFMDLAGPKLRTGPLYGGAAYARVRVGEAFDVVAPGAAWEGNGVAIECPVEAVFTSVRVGDAVWLDDGKLGGTVERVAPGSLTVRVTQAKPNGTKLRPDKGINFPQTCLDIPALTEKDAADLDFVVRHADAVALSFVRDEDDVLDLEQRLDAAGADTLGVVLKIETVAAFAHLPRVLLAALRRPCVGLMIARGDLAVEAGYERLAEVQEELLWIAEAAHVPAVWATQVLDSLARKGLPSRAEITDAAMGVRAEAVMLNKGPHILRAIATLDDIIGRMEAHQEKKRPLLRYLHVSDAL